MFTWLQSSNPEDCYSLNFTKIPEDCNQLQLPINSAFSDTNSLFDGSLGPVVVTFDGRSLLQALERVMFFKRPKFC